MEKVQSSSRWKKVPVGKTVGKKYTERAPSTGRVIFESGLQLTHPLVHLRTTGSERLIEALAGKVVPRKQGFLNNIVIIRLRLVEPTVHISAFPLSKALKWMAQSTRDRLLEAVNLSNRNK
ncbi:hypothetical protein RRG08_040571 [Elysia crispata]|uniref:Uncharacterized protein n=1 Tax=Elysia crispata TaxID=231223 RepID=A0AAE1DC57_9GAST|nr:hypothetical protein RRG08_040571 [Elysia crispata]